MTISRAGLIGNWGRCIPNPLTGSLPFGSHHWAATQRLWGADKVLAMALSSLLLSAGKRRPLQNLSAGTALITAGIAALGPEAVAQIVKTIAVFDDFCHANDPYEEHDFGSFEADGHTIFFKIDYFDSTLTVHSPDPSDPAVTKRVITIMLTEEY